MEPAQVYGGSEECHSSESGWTMYIGSPIDDPDDDDGDGDDYDDIDGNHDHDNEDESDDSMASDASSGPSHQGNPCGNGRSCQSLSLYKKEKKYCLENKAKKPLEKQRADQRKEEKEQESVFMAKKSKGPVLSEEKVRKTMWMNKTTK